MNCTATLRVISRAGSSHVSPIGRLAERALARGGGARRRVLEMTFAAEEGVTDAGYGGLPSFHETVVL